MVPVLPLLLELVRLGGNLSVLSSRWWMCCFSPLLVWLGHLTRLLSWRGNTEVLLWLDFVGVLVWGVNYYLILVWLQPLLFGGRWITDNELLPWWVALSTHLVFGWTMAVISPFGEYRPYRRLTD